MKETALESERNSLERRINDLDELRVQIRVVKRRQWEEHIADWRKRDTDIGLTGNKGVLMKLGCNISHISLARGYLYNLMMKVVVTPNMVAGRPRAE